MTKEKPLIFTNQWTEEETPYSITDAVYYTLVASAENQLAEVMQCQNNIIRFLAKLTENLHEIGILGLEDTISELLPEFKINDKKTA